MSDYDTERLNEAQMALEDAQERIRNLEMALADMTVLAGDYKAWVQRLEGELRELDALGKERDLLT